MRLRKMTADEFERFRQFSVADYAREIVKAGRMSPENALAQAQTEFDGQLKWGVETPDNSVMVIEREGVPMGFIWYLFCKTDAGLGYAFLCDFYVIAEYRRKGVAAEALRRMEADAAENGCAQIRLYVWKNNAPANALYRKCGYQPAKLENDGMYMKKTLVTEEKDMNMELLDKVRAEINGKNALETACQVAEFHRIQASPGFRAAANLCNDKLNVLGVSSEMQYEPADGIQRYRTIRNFKEWSIESGVCSIVVPETMHIADYSKAALSIMPKSCPCDYSETPIEVVYMDRGTEPEAYADVDIEGKLLFIHENFNSYLKWAVDQRGAAGFITDFVMEPENHHDVLRYTSFWWEETPEERKAFGFVLSPDRGKELEKICLKARETGVPVLANCKIDSALYAGKLDYVNAFIPGETDEEIWITAHLCHPRNSANDNGSGVGATIEAMRAIRELVNRGELTLKRGIRLLLIPEMTGTYAYLNQIGSEAWKKVLAGINLDMVGAKQTDGYGPLILTQTPHTTPTIANAAARLVLNIAKKQANYLRKDTKMPLFNSAMSDFTGGSDHYILSDPTVNIPTLMLGQWPDKYYHTSGDTAEVLSADTLQVSASLAAMFAVLMSQMDNGDVPMLVGELQQLMMQDITRLDNDAQTGVLKSEQLGKACAELKQYYADCVADIANFLPEAQGLDIEAQFLNGVCDMAQNRLQQRMGGMSSAIAYIGAVPVRTYAMPIDSWVAVLDTPEKKAAMAAFSKGAEKRMNDPKVAEILTQYYIDGKRTIEEIAECVSIDCREADKAAIREYIQLLADMNLVTMQAE